MRTAKILLVAGRSIKRRTLAVTVEARWLPSERTQAVFYRYERGKEPVDDFLKEPLKAIGEHLRRVPRL
jgi:hypothetical protein